MVGAGRRRGQRLRARRSAPTSGGGLDFRGNAVSRIAFVPAGRLPPGAGMSLSAALVLAGRVHFEYMASGHAAPEQRRFPTPAAEAPLRGTPAPAEEAQAEGDAISVPRGEIRTATRGWRGCARPVAREQRGRFHTRKLRGWPLVERWQLRRGLARPSFRQAPGVPSARVASAAATRSFPSPAVRAARTSDPSDEAYPRAPAPARTPPRGAGLRWPPPRRARPPAPAPARCPKDPPRPPVRCPACRRRSRR